MDPTCQIILRGQVQQIIKRLKIQEALSSQLFQNDLNPFFPSSFNIPIETEIKELFEQHFQQSELAKQLITFLDPTYLSEKPKVDKNIMSFAEVILYKVLPCPDKQNCSHCPRQIAAKNSYKDQEYECPFYHHERDRRRLAISSSLDEEEFEYKASYFEEGRSQTEKQKYSQNYFESMFHPIYYKMFQCKRKYCSGSNKFCPFYHSEKEKQIWDQRFKKFITKERVSYVKDKKKYYETAGSSLFNGINEIGCNSDKKSCLNQNKEKELPNKADRIANRKNFPKFKHISTELLFKPQFLFSH